MKDGASTGGRARLLAISEELLIKFFAHPTPPLTHQQQQRRMMMRMMNLSRTQRDGKAIYGNGTLEEERGWGRGEKMIIWGKEKRRGRKGTQLLLLGLNKNEQNEKAE